MGNKKPTCLERMVSTQQTINQVNQKSIDVSGDKKPDTVTLVAQKDDKDSPRVEQLYLLVEDKANKKYIQVSLPDSFGYEPSIGFYEFNKDKTMEIMVALPTGGSSGSISYYIYSLKNNKATALFLPNEASTPEFKGKFVSNYSAVITSKSGIRHLRLTLKIERKYTIKWSYIVMASYCALKR
jgi:hypothetical protein